MDLSKTAEPVGSNNVVIGVGARSDYDNCIVIGAGMHSTRDNQIIIGNEEINVSGEITQAQLNAIQAALETILEEGRHGLV